MLCKTPFEPMTRSIVSWGRRSLEVMELNENRKPPQITKRATITENTIVRCFRPKGIPDSEVSRSEIHFNKVREKTHAGMKRREVYFDRIAKAPATPKISFESGRVGRSISCKQKEKQRM